MYPIASYFSEREDFECLVKPEGFAAYKISGEVCYLKDIWVHKDFRKTGLASKMADEIASKAKLSNCRYLTGSVAIGLKSTTDSVKVLLAYGFLVHDVVNGGIIFRKEI